MRGEQFETVEVGVKIGKVYGIAMSQSRAIEQRAVLVDGTRPVDDFVATILVDVAHR